MQEEIKLEAYEKPLGGGTVEQERLIFARLARDILDVQLDNKKKGKASGIERSFHAKCVIGVDNAELTVVADLPPRFRLGFFQANRKLGVTVRLSNASGVHQPDHKRDMRGAALRIKVSDDEYHDLLMTNFPVSHARDAEQFVAFARAMAGSKLLLLPRLLRHIGLQESIRIFKNVSSGARPVDSLALETYWSRGAIKWGNPGPVRYLLRPARDAAPSPPAVPTDPDYLHREFARRLRNGDVTFELCLQPFVDEQRTPIEDGSIEWTEAVSPAVHVATLRIPQQDVDAAAGRATERLVDALAFSPWHTTEAFRPVGNLNRARKAVYAASAAHRASYRFREHAPLRNVVIGKAVAAIFHAINRVIPWHRLPWQLGLLNLSIYRDELRRKNLFDTGKHDAPPSTEAVPSSVGEQVRTVRMIDGHYNDLSEPNMGCSGSTFGRTMKPVYKPDLFDRPNPIAVSRELMTREAFIPARSLNVLAAAWIQFQVHDWVNHKRVDIGDPKHDILIPTPGGDAWKSHVKGSAEAAMRIAGNEEAYRAPEGYPVFRNVTTPWWDGSEVYGDTPDKATSLREDGGKGACLRLDKKGYLAPGLNGMTLTGFSESWWLGLSAMHTLFAREHNVLCGELQRAYPGWNQERIYQTARLIVSALIAKIHTVEWTPAILATKTIEVGLRANWYGAPKDWLSQLGIWLLDAHELKGIPQTLPNHHDCPYSLTEEFASVYRLHPLIPDDYQFFDLDSGLTTQSLTFDKIRGLPADDLMRDLKLHNVLYSLGIAHPGAITLHNYPNSLRRFQRENGEIIDLSVVDIVRDRRRGVPRFNDFRAALHKPRIRDWEELSNDPETMRKMRELYGSIDMVDTMVGLHAEPPPVGFGFSDTAFRIFILMASRRLQSDRFLTVDFRPEIYSPLGLDWIDKNGMTSVTLRNCPELAAVLPRTASAFAPFRPVVPARQAVAAGEAVLEPKLAASA